MIDSIPSSANSLIDFAAQLADKRKAAASGGSSSSESGLSETAVKLVKSPLSIADIGPFKEDREAEMDRQKKLSDLMRLEVEKNRLGGYAEIRRRKIEFLEKSVSIPPEPAQSVTGNEAKRVWEMGRQDARKGGRIGFPPQKGETYIFLEGGFQYNIRGDGTIGHLEEPIFGTVWAAKWGARAELWGHFGLNSVVFGPLRPPLWPCGRHAGAVRPSHQTRRRML